MEDKKILDSALKLDKQIDMFLMQNVPLDKQFHNRIYMVKVYLECFLINNDYPYYKCGHQYRCQGVDVDV